MSLLKKFTSTFEQQVTTLGLSIEHISEDIIIAKNHEKYLRLELYYEDFGNSERLVIADLLVIKGNINKALESDLFPVQTSYTQRKELGIFTLHTDKSVIVPEVSLDLLKSMGSKILKTDDFIMIFQKSNYGILRKDPLCIKFLKGKITIDQLFYTISTLEIPNGLYIQKPSGLHDPTIVKKRKKLIKILYGILSILTIALLIFKIFLKIQSQ